LASGDFSHQWCEFLVCDISWVKIAEYLWLGSRPAYGLLNVLENDLQIKILHLPLDNGISGASLVDDRLGAGMLINANDVPWRKNFDMAHELFHIVTRGILSREEIGDGTAKTNPEKFANAFASSLLLPKRKEMDLTMRKSLYANMDVRTYPERYVSLCCRCLIEGKISRGVFSTYLEIDRSDIDSYLDNFGFRENNREEIAAA
jgi:hypothetical protein